MSELTKQCPYCAETIKAEAAICRFCGRSLTDVSSLKASSSAPKKRGTVRWLLIGLGIVVLGCCAFSILGSLLSSGNDSNDQPTVRASADTGADVDTDTPAPTATPLPRPTAPPIASILETVDGMTDVQRNAYNDSIAGSRVEDWEGVITEVNEEEILGGFTVYVDTDSSRFGSEVFIDVSEEVALTLPLGASIVFSGDLEKVSDILGTTVYIENAVITIVE